MSWPPRGCSRERPQDGVCARAVGGRGALVRGVRGGRTSTCNLGRAFPPATPPSSLPEPCRGCEWGVGRGRGVAGGAGGKCSIRVFSLALQGRRGLSLVCVVSEARGKPAARAAVGRLAGSAPWTAQHPTPARQAHLSRARLFRGASAGERGPPLRPGRGWGQGAGRWTAPGRTDGQLPAAPAPGSGSVLCFPQTCLLVSWEHEATLPWRPRRSRGPEWGT